MYAVCLVLLPPPSVCHCPADARKDLAVHLKSSGGGGLAPTAGLAPPQQAAGDDDRAPVPAQLEGSTEAASLLLGPQDSDAYNPGTPGYKTLQITAGTAFPPVSAQQQEQREPSDAQLQQDMDGHMLLHNQASCKSSGGTLELAPAQAKVAESGVAAVHDSTGAQKRPGSAAPVKQTLFDFSPAEPTQAAVHYMRQQTDQGEDFRCVVCLCVCLPFEVATVPLTKVAVLLCCLLLCC